jgi:hypothetical protein
MSRYDEVNGSTRNGPAQVGSSPTPLKLVVGLSRMRNVLIGPYSTWARTQGQALRKDAPPP